MRPLNILPFIKAKAAGAFACLLLAAAVAASALLPETEAKAENRFTPRLTSPAQGDKAFSCYTSNNIFYTSGYGMPNCTCYAYGRAYEILKSKPKLCLNDAGEWYEYNKNNGCYPYGQQPKAGAIACWQNADGGHVAVVEAIKEDKIILSQSAWGYKYFYISNENRKSPGQKGWKFQGYIYIRS